MISFDDAQAMCRDYNGSLTIFPTDNEANTVRDLIAIDLNLDIYGERANTHLYWIGLKYNSRTSKLNLLNT